MQEFIEEHKSKFEMTHKEKRKRMDQAIKEIIILFLRVEKFKGSYPHFRREKNGQLNLMTFQFSLYSPQFVVEIANCSPDGMITSFGKELNPAQCRVNHMGNRLRIGSLKSGTDYWYDFDKQPLFGNIFEKRAREVLENWFEAENWWYANPYELK